MGFRLAGRVVSRRYNWTGGTTGGTLGLDAPVHAGHLLGANPCRYWIVPFYTSVAMLLKMRESFVRDQGVGGSNPLAPIIKISWLRRVRKARLFSCPHECPHELGLVAGCVDSTRVYFEGYATGGRPNWTSKNKRLLPVSFFAAVPGPDVP